MKRRSANCMLVDPMRFLPVRRQLWIVCLQRWVRCIVGCVASRVGELRHLGTLHVQCEKHCIKVFTPHVWSQQNYITVFTIHVYIIRNDFNFFALHVQSHGIGSQLSHCTCRVMALDHSSHTARAESRHWITVFILHIYSHGTAPTFFISKIQKING